MKWFNFIQSAWLGLFSSMKRFPLTIILAIITTAMIIIISELTPSAGEEMTDQLIRMTMVFALGIPLSVSIKLFFERKGQVNHMAMSLTFIGAIGLLVLYYFFLLGGLDLVQISRYIAIHLALYLVFVLLPYYYKRDYFELYVVKLITTFLVTIVYSAVLFIGLAAIFFTVNKLLNVPVVPNIYFYIWVTIAGVFAPIFFLAGLPAYHQQMEKMDYPKLLHILLLRIVMPLITIYSAILYIYFVKIIVTFEWPIGLVSHLVLWYSVLSIGVLLFISPFRESNKWARNFTFWFPKLILPILVMMFISIGIRINAYGITENRYYVVALSLWVTGLMLYYAVRNRIRNIVIPLSLAIVAVIAVMGPWSAFSVSTFSQNNRLEAILTHNNMLQSKTIVQASQPVNHEDQAEISQILYYFSKKERLADARFLPADFKLADMDTVFGFPYKANDRFNAGEEHYAYSIDSSNGLFSVEGYEYLARIQNYQQDYSVKEGSLQINFNNHQQEAQLSVLIDHKELYEVKLSEVVLQIAQRIAENDKSAGDGQGSMQHRSLTLEEATFTDSNDHVDIKVIVVDVYGKLAAASDLPLVDGIDFYVLVNTK